MSDLWERVKKTAAEIYATASEKTVEGVNIGVKQLDVVSVRRELSREFAGLGGRVHQLLKRGEAAAIPEDPTVKSHLARLEELEQRLEEREREIEDIRQGRKDEAVESEAATAPDAETEAPAADAGGPKPAGPDAPATGAEESGPRSS